MTSFTAAAIPAAEARVAGDLARIVEAVRGEAAADSLLAVFLLGGYARGEGAVRTAEDGDAAGVQRLRPSSRLLRAPAPACAFR